MYDGDVYLLESRKLRKGGMYWSSFISWKILMMILPWHWRGGGVWSRFPTGQEAGAGRWLPLAAVSV